MIFIKTIVTNIFKVKKIVFFLILLSFSASLFSQEDTEEELDFISITKGKKSNRSKKSDNLDIDLKEFSNVAFKLSFFIPSVAAEFKLSDKFSLELAGKLNFEIYTTGSSANPQSLPKLILFPYPVAHIEPKWNYNIVKRYDKNKNVKGFSSNFLSLFTSYRIKVSPSTFNSLVIGPTWGIQRTIKKIGYFKLNTGLGYYHVFDKPSNVTNFNPLPVMPIVDIQLGIMF